MTDAQAKYTIHHYYYLQNVSNPNDKEAFVMRRSRKKNLKSLQHGVLACGPSLSGCI